MKHKSVTFRCSKAQHTRVEEAVKQLGLENKSALLNAALDDFLSFAEQEHIAALNLFELVELIDNIGNAEKFASQA